MSSGSDWVVIARPRRPNLAVLLEAARMQVRLIGAVWSTYVSSALMPAVYMTLLSDRLDTTAPAEVVTKVVLAGLWGGTAWNCGLTLRWDAMTGVLPEVLVSRAHVRDVVVGRCVGGLVFTTCCVTASSCVTLSFIEPGAVGASLPVLGTVLPLAATSAVSMGFLLSGILMGARGAYWAVEMLVYVVLLCGGLLVPVDELPAVARPVALLVSLHWIEDLVVPGHSVAMGLVAASVLTMLYAVLGAWLLAASVRRLRATGSVEHV
jgi:ABC-2 type transport system permease protein